MNDTEYDIVARLEEKLERIAFALERGVHALEHIDEQFERLAKTGHLRVDLMR